MEIHALGLRRILLAYPVAILCFGVVTARAQDGNAVGGSVRSAETDQPLEDVSVTILKAQDVRDRTRKEDGVYTLKVPASMTSFDILYEKSGYLNATDPGVLNDQKQQKRPIVRLTPVSAIESLPPETLQELVQDAKANMERGRRTNEKDLEESAKKNLSLLLKNIPATDPARIGIIAMIKKIDPGA